MIDRSKIKEAVKAMPRDQLKLAQPKLTPMRDFARTQMLRRATETNFRTELPASRIYVVTAAQNATPVNEPFLAALRTYCKHCKAELVVIPIRYRNPSTREQKNEDADDDYWDDSVRPYLLGTRVDLNQGITVCGDVRVQATTANPLSGLNALTHAASAIFGHCRVELETVPTLDNKSVKIMSTTGAVTQPDYSDTKAGTLSAFHHVFGALVVEIVDKQNFHLRQINACSHGSFIDIDTEYLANGKTRKAPRPFALVPGDVHVDVADPVVVATTYDSGGIVDTLRPLNVVLHDVSDGLTHSHHDRGNLLVAIAKARGDRINIRDEINRTCAFIRERVMRAGQTTHIVNSNHDDFLRQWFNRYHWSEDAAINFDFHYETFHLIRDSIHFAPNGPAFKSPFEAWCERLVPGVRFLDDNRPLVYMDIAFHLHGHRGPNGARGSRKNLRRVGSKLVIGHSHSPGISEGCFQAGTSSYLRLGYNSGPSSWAHVHVLTYANGKRTLINILPSGSWRLH